MGENSAASKALHAEVIDETVFLERLQGIGDLLLRGMLHVPVGR